MSWDILPKGNLQYFLQKLKAKFDLKVDKEAGKGLSANDYTTTEKNKLAGIEAGAQVNPTIDSALSDSSTNAVQNKVVKAALDGKAGREEIPTKVSQLTNDSGYTTNTGTVTQVKVGSAAYNPSSGVVSLPSYPAAVAVKGNAESTYRTGNVNITPANIGLGNVNNTKDSSKNVNSANKVNYTKSTSEGTFTYPCEVEGALSDSEDKIPNSAAVISYLNSNIVSIANVTNKRYANFINVYKYGFLKIMYIFFSSSASEMLPSGAYTQIGVLPSEYRPINQYNLSDPSTVVNIQIEIGGSIKAWNYTSTKPSCYIIIPYF